VLLADFGERGLPAWTPPDAAPVETLRQLVGLLPRPLPHGRLYSDLVLAHILLRLGEAEHAAQYAAETYARTPSTDAALVVARAAGALGDHDTSVGWLRAAFDAGTNMHGLEAAVEHAPELRSLRDDPRSCSFAPASTADARAPAVHHAPSRNPPFVRANRSSRERILATRPSVGDGALHLREGTRAADARVDADLDAVAEDGVTHVRPLRCVDLAQDARRRGAAAVHPLDQFLAG
jgi:hypothetical protein